jgi:hypothetical protein
MVLFDILLNCTSLPVDPQAKEVKIFFINLHQQTGNEENNKSQTGKGGKRLADFLAELEKKKSNGNHQRPTGSIKRNILPRYQSLLIGRNRHHSCDGISLSVLEKEDYNDES